MSMPGMLMLGVVVIELVVGIPVVLVAEAVAIEVVIMSITIVMVFVADQNVLKFSEGGNMWHGHVLRRFDLCTVLVAMVRVKDKRSEWN